MQVSFRKFLKWLAALVALVELTAGTYEGPPRHNSYLVLYTLYNLAYTPLYS